MSLLALVGGSRRVGDGQDLLYGAVAFSLLYHKQSRTGRYLDDMLKEKKGNAGCLKSR